MKRLVIAVQVLIALISTAADCIAVLDFFCKLYRAARESPENSWRKIQSIQSRYFACVNALTERIRNMNVSIKSNFEECFNYAIERIRWNRKYILI